MNARVSARATSPAALRRWLCDERGTAIVEFALIFPVLLMMLLATIDFGRMMAVGASLAAAARDGARMGAAITNLSLNEATAGRGALLSGVYCLGLGVPFIVAALAYRRTEAFLLEHLGNP